MSSSAPQSLPLVKTVSFALKQHRLYSDKHPITQETMKNLELELERYFDTHERLTFGAMQHRLLVDGAVISEKEAAAVDLAKDLERLGIEGLVFEKGINLPEVARLVAIMAMRAKSLADRGGFRKAFDEEKFPHVRLSQGKFQLVEDGEVVVDESQAGEGKGDGPGLGPGPGGGEIPVNDIGEIIRRIRQDPVAASETTQEPDGGSKVIFSGCKLALDAEKLVDQLEKNTKSVAEMTLSEAVDEVRLEQLIRKTVKLLIDGLLSYLVEQGKDITKALEKLARELEKGLAGIADSGDFDRLRKKIPGIFEEATDEFRIQMIRKTCQDHPGDVKQLEKIAKKLFKDKDVRDRLQNTLKEELSPVGLSAEMIQGIFSRIDEQEDKKKRKVSIDAEELEELRRKAEMFDSQGDAGEDKRVQLLELENKMIRHQKQRMDAVIHNLAEGLLIVDENGKVVLMNPAAEKMLGVKQGDKVGKTVTEGLSEEHVVSMASGDLRDKKNRMTQNVELYGANEETKRVLKASTAVIENEDGHTVGMVSVLSDITRQKELDDLKSKFVSNVSHELRTPLVAIQKSLELMVQRELGDITPDQEKFLSLAQRNIERLSRLINDLLDVSRLEAGQMNLKPSKFPMTGLIQHVVATVETWAGNKGIKLKTDFPGVDTVELEADPDRLTQVITNLVGNAVKFTPDGGTITVELRKDILDSSIPGEKCLEIGVRDTGIGIAPEDQKKIFDKFVQVGLVQPAGVSSSGLGLTITKEIVELHGGRIWVESEPGKGSRFAFRIPLKFTSRQKVRNA